MVDNREYRSIDGTGNNTEHTAYGTPGSQLLRFGEANYLDDGYTPDDAGRANPREISNTVNAQDILTTSDAGVSSLFTFWGQFIDHDLSLTLDTGPETLNIPVAEGDELGVPEILLSRSQYAPGTGTGVDNPRQQVSAITSFIDASMVYGSDDERNAFLRADGGKLKVGQGDILPFNDGSQSGVPADAPRSFVAGDIRANENFALTSLHTLFVREHNRLVDDLAQTHPEYDAETLYQEAKLLNEAMVQHITYDEFLPILLGEDALPAYHGYDPNADPSISNLFSAAAFRVGHTLLPPTLSLDGQTDDAGQPAKLALRDAFFRPADEFDDDLMTALLAGLAGDEAQRVDPLIVDDVRNFLIGEPTGGLGFDLAALNIQRGRDHGLPAYNDAREAFGLERVDDFADITSDADVQADLAKVYPMVDDIDPWVGGLAEDPVGDGLVGELFYTVIRDQFTRARDGDRFFYEGRLDQDELDAIKATSLSDVIARNTDNQDLQENVFIVPEHARDGMSSDALLV